MGAFGLPLTNRPQGEGFQLGQGRDPRGASSLPVPNASDLTQALGQGGGVDIGALLGFLQSLSSPATDSQRFAGDLGLTGPTQGEAPVASLALPAPVASPAPASSPAPEISRRPPPRSRAASGPRPARPSPRRFPSSGSSTSVFQAPLRGGTLSRAQEIANLVGGTVATQGLTRGPADTDPDLFDRVNTVINIGGKDFTFNQLEIALQNRGTAGLANTLALEGGITNEFTNTNATAGSFGKF